MKQFHDVEIYAGTVLAATASRLELGANKMLRGIMSQVTLCDGCREPLVIILAEEDETTVRETVDRLSYFKSKLSIFQNPAKVNSLLERLSLRPGKDKTRSAMDMEALNATSQVIADIEDQSYENFGDLAANELRGIKTEEESPHVDEESPYVDEETDEHSSEFRIVSVESCAEEAVDNIPDDEIYEDIEVEVDSLRELKVDVQHLDITDLISPEEPSLAPGEKMTLTKKTASDTVYKITEDKTNKSLPPYSCGLCPNVSSCKSALYRHYCHAHYKDQLLEVIGDNKDNCQFCNLKYKKRSDAISHVGRVHNKLLDFLPKRFHVRSTQKTKSSSPLLQFACGLCQKTFRDRSDLYDHYSLCHYRKDLRPFINGEGDGCTMCEVVHKNPTEANKIRHIGTVHRMIENFLPSQFQIPKISDSQDRLEKVESSSVENEIMNHEEEDDPSFEPLSEVSLNAGTPRLVRLVHGEKIQRGNILKLSDSARKGNLNLSPDQGQVEDQEEGLDEQKKGMEEENDNSILGTFSNIQECRLCPSKQISRSKLYAHYALRHYRQDIKQYIGENKRECQFCRLQFTTLDNLIVHIGSAHNKVEEHLPAEYQIARTRRGQFSDLGTQTLDFSSVQNSETQKEQNPSLEDKNLTKDSGNTSAEDENSSVDSPKKPSLNERILQCHICGSQRYKWGRLYAHYSFRHYKAQLMSLIDQKKLKCNYCGKKKSSADDLVLHIGVHHKKVEDYLPENFNPRLNLLKSSDFESEVRENNTQSLRREDQKMKIIDDENKNVETPNMNNFDHSSNMKEGEASSMDTSA